jgi:hypothetical protein
MGTTFDNLKDREQVLEVLREHNRADLAVTVSVPLMASRWNWRILRRHREEIYREIQDEFLCNSRLIARKGKFHVKYKNVALEVDGPVPNVIRLVESLDEFEEID